MIKCEKCVSCLMKYLKKYEKWPETYMLILHSCYWTPQFQNFAIPPKWLSHSITQRYCYPSIALSLHNFKLLPICWLGFLGLVIPLNFFKIGRNYVSIIVTIISNITLLQCYLPWIFIAIRRLLQLSVHWGLNPPPPSKTSPFCFAKPPLKFANYPNPPF